MYYEEQWRGDDLWWRGTPDGTWKKVHRAGLLRRIKDLEAKVQEGAQAPSGRSTA